ncbi:unnamed protein product [Parnassius mnemosyne]|uniref:Androgen-dependent TFPI-regulating protein n=1 Tax=Parnassius mnemosyne TaxID=213953 RepID=A0AAV1M772_9NEOP
MLLPIFHLSAAAIDSYVIWYDQNYVELPVHNELLKDLPLKSRTMFLTIWCLIMQIAYHTIAFLNDIIGSNDPSPKKKPLIRLIKDTLFSLAFPIAIYVSVAFWSIYTVDKDLIFPDVIEKLYPTWMNHVMHTMVTIFMFLELIMTSRNYPSRAVGISITLAFSMSYIAWYLMIYFKTGVWVYPIFDTLNWPSRIVFIVISNIVILGVYVFSEKLNYLLSPSQPKLKKR